MALPTGTVTFLFTDVEGSTKLLQEHPRDYPVAIARHHEILADSVRRHGGAVFETVGDAVYAAFSRAEDAACAAADGQRGLAGADGPVTIRVRMGIHTGDVQLRGDHYYGPTLYRCARIMAVGHGGQILVSDVTAAILADLLPDGLALRDLGEHRLKDLRRAERIHQLDAAGLPSSFPPLRSLDAHAHNLPVFPTIFLGRERETAAVTALLRDPNVRLVTLTGPGGTGKTRLALQAAADVIDAFRGGVYFVPLAEVLKAEQIHSALGSALGLVERGGIPIGELVANALREREALVVLDNFEQLLEHARAVSELLAAAPSLRILVTSRAPLRIRGEREFAVPPLDVPEVTDDPVAALARCGSTRLFLERAREIRPDLVLTPASATAIAEICRRVDGLPLAIELAAARVRVLAPDALLARLERRLPLLTSGARDLPARQRTLRDTIAWSYDLLDARERTVFRRAAAFAGGWDLEAADQILDPEKAGDVLDVLDALVGKSLVRRVDQTEGDRFVMLETIREYAVEHLDESGERADLARRHAAYFADLTERALPHLRGADQLGWLRRLDAESENLAAALACSLDGPGDARAAWRMGAALGHYWQLRGRASEASRRLSRLVRQPADVEDGVRALALAYAGFFAGERGDLQDAQTWSAAGLEAARRSGEPAALAVALSARMFAASWEGIEDVARELGTLARSTPDPWVAAFGYMCEGEWFRARGEDDASAEDYERALERARVSGDRSLAQMSLLNLGNHFLRHGDPTRARKYLVETMRINDELDDAWGMAYSLAALGGVLVESGDHERALAVFGAVESWFRSMGLRMQGNDRADLERSVARARDAIPSTTADRAWARGTELTLEQVTPLVSGTEAGPDVASAPTEGGEG